MGVAGRIREIWYEEGHAPLYLVQLPSWLDAPPDGGSGWTQHVDAVGVLKRAIALRTGDRLRYHLGIPPRGVFHAWMATRGGAGRTACRLRLKTTDGRVCEWSRTLVTPADRWTLWAVPLAELGDAEGDLELSAQSVDGDSGLTAVWGNPAILSRRRPRELAALARAFIALFGPRAAIRKAWELISRPTFDRADDYASWRRHQPLRAPVASASVSILVRAGNASDAVLGRSIDSIRRQTHRRWQICVVLPPARAARVAGAQVIVDDGDGEESWSRLLQLADGDVVTTLDAGDELAPHALAAIAGVFASDGVDVAYSDEDRLAPDGTPSDPF